MLRILFVCGLRIYADAADIVMQGGVKPIQLIDEELTYQLNGIFFRVQNKLGRFCNERQYCDALEQELISARISYEREKILDPYFPGEKLGRNRVDFFVEGRIPIEVKAKRIVTTEDYYQLRRYLSVLHKKLGIIVNFRMRYIRAKRILNGDVQ